jgi:hypothetical protein
MSEDSPASQIRLEIEIYSEFSPEIFLSTTPIPSRLVKQQVTALFETIDQKRYVTCRFDPGWLDFMQTSVAHESLSPVSRE